MGKNDNTYVNREFPYFDPFQKIIGGVLFRSTNRLCIDEQGRRCIIKLSCQVPKAYHCCVTFDSGNYIWSKWYQAYNYRYRWEYEPPYNKEED